MLYSQLHVSSYSLVWFWVLLLLLLLLRLAFIHPVIKSPFQTLRDISLGRRVELKFPPPQLKVCAVKETFTHVIPVCLSMPTSCLSVWGISATCSPCLLVHPPPQFKHSNARSVVGTLASSFALFYLFSLYY